MGERIERDEFVTIKVTAEEKATFASLARKNGMNLSTYFRWLLLRESKEL